MSKLDCPDDFHEGNCPFLAFKNRLPIIRPTDGRTDGRMDTSSYRDGWTHLKQVSHFRQADLHGLIKAFASSDQLSLQAL